MATAAQIDANRLNARNSTGPRTEAGKSVSRFNALQHGVEARSLVIPGEDPAELEALAAQYFERFQPVGPSERFFLETIVHADWDRRRYSRIEGRILQQQMREEKASAIEAVAGKMSQLVYRRLAASERSYFRALRELQREQNQRLTEKEALAEALALSAALALTGPAKPAAAPMESAPIGFVPDESRQPVEPAAKDRSTGLENPALRL
jgi:hypothetical protein